MSSYKFEMEATIGYDNYSNLKPKVTLEGNDLQEMINIGLTGVSQVSKQVKGAAIIDVIATPESGEKTKFKEVKRDLITCGLTGTQLFYSEESHRYEDIDGNTYESSSRFPDKFFTQFNREMILGKLIEKYPTLKSADIDEMWGLNGSASTSYGTAVHSALENWLKFREMGEVLRGGDEKVPNKALSRNPFIKHIVEKFIEVFPYGDKEIITEEVISNDKYMQAGRMDMFVVVDKDKKICRLADFKTDTNIDETKYQVADSPFKPISASERKAGAAEKPNTVPNTLLGFHTLQLSHQKFMLESAGWTVEDTADFFWLNPNKLLAGDNPWEKREVKLVDVSGVFNK